MKIYAGYLLHQIARFGAVRRQELEVLCQGRCGKTSLYECLLELSKAKLICRISHPIFPVTAYQITDQGFEMMLGETGDSARKLRKSDLLHTLRVAETLISLARYECVTGFATEYEVLNEEWRDFSGSKIPDGVIQVTRGDLTYELAIEVETTRKSWLRVDEFLEKYRDAFTRRLQCSGVIVVCDQPSILKCFDLRLTKIEKEIAKKFLLVPGSGVPKLNSMLYGEQRKSPGITPEKARTIFGGKIQYLPIKSTFGSKWGRSMATDIESQSQNSTLEEDLPLISTSST